MELTEGQAAYLAGLIDGEGSIIIRRETKAGTGRYAASLYEYYSLYVMINITNRQVVDWVASVTGIGQVTIRKTPSHYRQMYRYQASTRQAGELLRVILPYLIVKKREAEIGLALQDSKQYTGKRGRSAEQKAYEDRLYLESRLLKQHGEYNPRNSHKEG